MVTYMELRRGRGSRIGLMVLVAMIMIEAAKAMLAPLDFLALQSVNKKLQDMPGSTFLSMWDFSKDPCSFPGVLCSTEEPQRVVALNLGDPAAGSPGLKGKLDGSLGLLSSLVEFTLVPGQVVGSIPETIAQLTQLQFLGISRNYLSGTLPQNIGALKNLETLDLSYNQLMGSIPRSMGSLPILSNLILTRNKLTGTIPELAGAPLQRLDLKRNMLSGALPSLPSSLKYLSLSNNQLSGGIENLGGLQSLSYVDLSFNKFSGSIPSSLFGSPHMSSLQLQRNSLSGPVQPNGVVNIPTVDLSYNRLSGLISPLLASAETLYLNNNLFTGALPKEFVDRLLSAHIQTLYLQHNYLSQISISPSAKLPLSSSLCIQYNCLLPPIKSPCPASAGRQQSRPQYQCKGK